MTKGPFVTTRGDTLATNGYETVRDPRAGAGLKPKREAEFRKPEHLGTALAMPAGRVHGPAHGGALGTRR